MLKQKTTFVVGAGASCDFGFPTGPGLQEKIVEWLKPLEGGHRFASDLVEKALIPQLCGIDGQAQREAYMAAAQRIIQGMPVAASIDNYLHTHRGDSHAVWLGKIAITLAILEAEQNSSLMVRNLFGQIRPTLQAKAYRESWYFPLMRMMTAGSDADQARLMLQNVRFVIFNYDRCLEVILLMTLANYYGISDREAEEILEEADIVHPYGQIGLLTAEPGEQVPFGSTEINVAKVASGIKTFTESVDLEIVSKARSFVSECDTLVFLGFGFLRQNMDLLKPRDARTARRIHATTFGISETDKRVVYDYLRDFRARETDCELGEIQNVNIGSQRSGFIDVENKTCRNLLDNHAIRLAA